MKKIACLTILAAVSAVPLAVHAQDFRWNQASVIASQVHPTYSLSQTGKNSFGGITSISSSQDLTLASPLEFGYIPPSKQGKRGSSRGLFLNQSNSTALNFSKSDKLDYGLDFSLDRKRDPYELTQIGTGKNQLSGTDFSTSAFINYRINPTYSLGSSIRYGTGYERGTQLSVSAKANKVFGKRHNLTAVFSVNWSNLSSASKNPFSALDWQQSQNYLSLNNNLNRTELRIGSSWNWNIDTNWSLSTGVSARHSLNSPVNNPFFTQRTPVTVFSIATYRF
ncbi:hypothetical protein [Undibacterium flavidum]|uniref:MipA/OmpV family protein n=1 Tax=Undibacterium flavidum TaxID=2762297 RepID=A0ABR6YD92_9BURK|nr:hypothetical protein [Undibacterium flavidum]MBC3874504.1 hypothetical protein [Undibacterium flavidum]